VHPNAIMFVTIVRSPNNLLMSLTNKWLLC